MNTSLERLPPHGAQKTATTSRAFASPEGRNLVLYQKRLSDRLSQSKSTTNINQSNEDLNASVKRKKKKIPVRMAIPDENASLQGRLSRVADCVGPLTNSKP